MEQIKPVPYRMKFERDYFAAKKAMRKSKREMRKALLVGIEAYLELKFGDDGLGFLPAVTAITDTGKLQAILTALRSDITLAEVQQLAAPD
ncbi:MAG: hypothetical protein IPK16_11585 [Anaerolineales bacterium]|nr:hypothetical protein [Anaerolineales bacterium]